MFRTIDILVVDDDADIRHFFDLLLTKEGYCVTTIGDPYEAIQLIKKDPKFKLILLDIRLPGLTGIEALEDLRTIRRDIPVVLMTANPSMETAVEAMKYGASDYIEKPFDNDVILKTIARILEEKGYSNDALEALHIAIGAKLRAARQAKDETLKELSVRTGLSVSLISQIERAETSASIRSLYHLSSCLDVSLSDLFTFT